MSEKTDKVALEIHFGDKDKERIVLTDFAFPDSIEHSIRASKPTIKVPFRDGVIAGQTVIESREITLRGRILATPEKSVREQLEAIHRALFMVQQRRKVLRNMGFLRFPRVVLMRVGKGIHEQRIASDLIITGVSETILNSYGASDITITMESADPFLYSGQESKLILPGISSTDYTPAQIGSDNADFFGDGDPRKIAFGVNQGYLHFFTLPIPQVSFIRLHIAENIGSPNFDVAVGIYDASNFTSAILAKVITATEWDAAISQGYIDIDYRNFVPTQPLVSGKQYALRVIASGGTTGQRQVQIVQRSEAFDKDLFRTQGTSLFLHSITDVLRWDIKLKGKELEFFNPGNAYSPLILKMDVAGTTSTSPFVWIVNTQDYLAEKGFLGRNFFIEEAWGRIIIDGEDIRVLRSTGVAPNFLSQDEVFPEGYLLPRALPGFNRLIVCIGDNTATTMATSSIELLFRPRWL